MESEKKKKDTDSLDILNAFQVPRASILQLITSNRKLGLFLVDRGEKAGSGAAVVERQGMAGGEKDGDGENGGKRARIGVAIEG